MIGPVPGTVYTVRATPVFASDRFRFEIIRAGRVVMVSVGSYPTEQIALDRGAAWCRTAAKKDAP